MSDYNLSVESDKERYLQQSHGVAPKRKYDPLPFDLFPRPDPESERLQCELFPCYKYYKSSCYLDEDARRLSAMDLIPKDAIVLRNAEAHSHRFQRNARESAKTIGYYRFKNEGMSTAISEDSSPTKGEKTRKRRIEMATHSRKETDFPTFQAIMRSPAAGKSEAPKKLGNRSQFIAELRRKLLKESSSSTHASTIANGGKPIVTTTNKRKPPSQLELIRDELSALHP